MTTIIRSIGTIHTPYTAGSQIPKGSGARHIAEATIVLDPELVDGLQDIDGFSHLYLIWLFDRSDGFDLTFTPPADDRPHGVFATRSPRRPNPLALTVVELLGREGGTLRVRGADMLTGTPLIDIKPYLSNVPDAALRRGWVEEAEARNRKA